MTQRPGLGLIGARVPRREDARHLTGGATFLADITLPGMREVAFVRSRCAHARLIGVTAPAEAEGCVFTAANLGDVHVLDAGPELETFRRAPYPPLATDRVRFVGQSIAACVAASRAQAEDIADAVQVDLEELPAVVDALAAMSGASCKLHESWPDNAYLRGRVASGDMAALRRSAPARISRQLKMNRQVTVHLEGRGVVAYWDPRRDELVIYLSTQSPHTARHGFARFLGLPERKVHVIAPDVGGGFGGKGRPIPEEFVVAALALRLGCPVRWVEDRREHFLASIHARDHYYDLTLYADRQGRILGLEGDIVVNAGAYALWPPGPVGEASLAVRNLPGPYRISNLDLNTVTVATNKAPIGAYRGVGRPGACFAIERLVDELANELGMEPVDVRRVNLVSESEMPYRTAADQLLDTGDYRATLEHAVRMIDLDQVRRRQARGEADGRRIGVGFSIYAEQTGHGTAEWAKRNACINSGYDSAIVRMLPDGSVYVLTGIQSHGQGLETTLAQIAATELGVDMSSIAVRFGDTAEIPFGFGTFGSRSTIFAGGAIAKACRELKEKLCAIGAHLLSADPERATIADGAVVAGSASIALSDVARIAHFRPEKLPPGMPARLEVSADYEPGEPGGVFSYGVHAAVVAVDPWTGQVEILDYAVAEDCGTIINPMIVDGQVIGGVAQGIGTALYEEIPYDEFGQPTATTFGDYLVPCAPEVPAIRVMHTVTPATATTYGQKGVGEGGAIGAPAAVVNAVADAFRATGAQFNETPLTPRRLCEALDRAQFVPEQRP
ncbi:MAG: xanthine dehydrogenase family protein molybdopterin-binding subunit [Burkholderiales bacterium]|nr:xanthine dehydrogenase family protein molybdopterin-binding subunit [Burkholderiales bacterium]